MKDGGTAPRRGYDFDDPAQVGPDGLVRYLGALLRVAALDGVAPEQGAFVSGVIAELGLDERSVERAWRLAGDRAIPTAKLIGGVRDGGLRICLLRDAYQVAAVDGTVTTGELEELRALAATLGVGSETATVLGEIFSVAPRGAREERGAGAPTPAPAEGAEAEPLAGEIAAAPDIPTLSAAAAGIQDLGRRLVALGVPAQRVTRTLVELNDRLNVRVIEIEVARAGLAGVDFCWIALGSQGREEQTLATDQDNGIVFDAGPGVDPEGVRARLLPVARRINDGLAACGFPLCPGNVMAGNPEWCASVEEWTAHFARWIRVPEPEALLNATIFFDLRPLWGNEALVRPLREFLAETAPGNNRFLLLLARNALGRRPPLGFFRDFAVETGGEAKGTIDLKLGGAALFVDVARVFALATGSPGPSTVARLCEARDRAGLRADDVEAWIDAFHHVQVLRLARQYDLAQTGGPVHNRIDPYALNPLERRFLREALRQAKQMQGVLARTYAEQAAL